MAEIVPGGTLGLHRREWARGQPEDCALIELPSGRSERRSEIPGDKAEANGAAAKERASWRRSPGG